MQRHLLEHFGVTVGAISGVLAARGKQVDLFGVIVLAVVTALGGGTIRDLILSKPVFWTADADFLVNAAITALIVFVLVRYHELPITVLMVADAFSLSMFNIVGAQKTLDLSFSPVIAVAMGVTTGVAGGILRDLLVGEIPLVFRQEIYLYATAAFCGALCFVLLERYGVDTKTSSLFGILITLLMRLAGIRWRIALPMFRPKATKSEESKPGQDNQSAS